MAAGNLPSASVPSCLATGCQFGLAYGCRQRYFSQLLPCLVYLQSDKTPAKSGGIRVMAQQTSRLARLSRMCRALSKLARCCTVEVRDVFARRSSSCPVGAFERNHKRVWRWGEQPLSTCGGTLSYVTNTLFTIDTKRRSTTVSANNTPPKPKTVLFLRSCMSSNGLYVFGTSSARCEQSDVM